MSAGHDHGPGGHSHAPASFGRAFALGIALNIAFVALETGYGIVANSMALLSDAGHNLSDVLGLGVAWGGAVLAKKSGPRHFTYGLKGSSILAALFNAIILFVAVGAILLEAIRRFFEPPSVSGGTVMAVAAAGILVNGATAWLFARGRHGDINIRGAYLHMAADAAVSAAVVVAGFVILETGIAWIDPVVSILVAGFILWSTAGLLSDSVSMTLSAAPPGIDVDDVRAELAALVGVVRVHDLHVWPMSTTETALTAHLVIPGGHPGDEFLREARHRLAHAFHIHHTTLQIELEEEDCPLS